MVDHIVQNVNHLVVGRSQRSREAELVQVKSLDKHQTPKPWTWVGFRDNRKTVEIRRLSEFSVLGGQPREQSSRVGGVDVGAGQPRQNKDRWPRECRDSHVPKKNIWLKGNEEQTERRVGGNIQVQADICFRPVFMGFAGIFPQLLQPSQTILSHTFFSINS